MFCKKKLLTYITLIALLISFVPTSAIALQESAPKTTSQFVSTPI